MESSFLEVEQWLNQVHWVTVPSFFGIPFPSSASGIPVCHPGCSQRPKGMMSFLDHQLLEAFHTTSSALGWFLLSQAQSVLAEGANSVLQHALLWMEHQYNPTVQSGTVFVALLERTKPRPQKENKLLNNDRNIQTRYFLQLSMQSTFTHHALPYGIQQPLVCMHEVQWDCDLLHAIHSSPVPLWPQLSAFTDEETKTWRYQVTHW